MTPVNRFQLLKASAYEQCDPSYGMQPLPPSVSLRTKLDSSIAMTKLPGGRLSHACSLLLAALARFGRCRVCLLLCFSGLRLGGLPVSLALLLPLSFFLSGLKHQVQTLHNASSLLCTSSCTY